jgi:hypothetical protein
MLKYDHTEVSLRSDGSSFLLLTTRHCHTPVAKLKPRSHPPSRAPSRGYQTRPRVLPERYERRPSARTMEDLRADRITPASWRGASGLTNGSFRWGETFSSVIELRVMAMSSGMALEV